MGEKGKGRKPKPFRVRRTWKRWYLRAKGRKREDIYTSVFATKWLNLNNRPGLPSQGLLRQTQHGAVKGEPCKRSPKEVNKNNKRLVKKLGSLSNDLAERIKENLRIILDLE